MDNERENDIISSLSSIEKNLAELVRLTTAKISNDFRVFEIPLPAANTEYRWQVPLGIKRLILQCRTNQDVLISNTRGIVSTPLPGYFTLKAGTSWSEFDVHIEALNRILYLASTGTNIIVEAICWV